MAIPSSIDTLCINTIRTLSMDAVQQANSGHPGTPIALAPVVYTLWQRFLRFDDYERLGEISRGSSSPPTVCARLRLITPGDG